MAAEPLVHLCAEETWADCRRRGVLQPTGGEFIHLSTPGQVHLPADRLYHGRRDLVLLYIDPARLSAPLRWEPGVPSDPDGMLFPHLYGDLPVDAVVSAIEYRPGPDGTFPPITAAPG